MQFFKRKFTGAHVVNPKRVNNFNAVATALIDSLRPSFRAHPAVDELRLDVILDLIVKDGEPEIGLESLLENLQDMNYEKPTAPITSVQAVQLKQLVHGMFSDKPEREQTYLAFIEKITIKQTSNFRREPGLRKFFSVYFSANDDNIESLEDIRTAVDYYRKGEVTDGDAKLLMKELHELIEKDLSDRALDDLIYEQWDGPVIAHRLGTWKQILRAVDDILTEGR